jgi:hypothetical protein
MRNSIHILEMLQELGFLYHIDEPSHDEPFIIPFPLKQYYSFKGNSTRGKVSRGARRHRSRNLRAVTVMKRAGVSWLVPREPATPHTAARLSPKKNEEHLMNKLVLSALVVVTSIAAASGALAQDTAAGKTTFNMQGLPFDRRRRQEQSRPRAQRARRPQVGLRAG